MRNKIYKGRNGNIFKFSGSAGKRYYRIVDFRIRQKKFLIKEVKKCFLGFKDMEAPAFWIDEKMLFKKYERC